MHTDTIHVHPLDVTLEDGRYTGYIPNRNGASDVNDALKLVGELLDSELLSDPSERSKITIVIRSRQIVIVSPKAAAPYELRRERSDDDRICYMIYQLESEGPGVDDFAHVMAAVQEATEAHPDLLDWKGYDAVLV